MFCSCVCIDSAVASHELYSSSSFTPCWDCAWGKNNTLQPFIEHHPLKLCHLLHYSTANTTQSNTVSQHHPVSVFTNLVFPLTWTYHLLLLRTVLEKMSSIWTLRTICSADAKKKLNSTEICWCNLTAQTARINVIRSSVLQKRGKRDGCTQSPLHSVTVCSVVRGNTVFSWKPNWNLMPFKWMKLYRQCAVAVCLILFYFPPPFTSQ